PVAPAPPPPPRPAAPPPPAPAPTAAPKIPQMRINVPAQAPSAPAVAVVAAAPPVPAPQIRINIPTQAPTPPAAVAPPAPVITPPAPAVTPVAPPPQPPLPVPQPPAPQPPQPTAAPSAPKIKVQLHSHAPPAPSAAASDEAAASHPCHKHPGQFATEQCVICKKPICPKCMELFGYVCSAYCEGQAERLKIEIPFYAGKKTAVEGRYWKKVKLMSGALAVLMLGLLGAYGWYYFVGMRPSLVHSLKFPGGDQKAFCKLISKDEVILRHGNKLARHDLKNDKEVWSVTLIDKEQVTKAAEEALAKQKAETAAWKVRRARLKAAGRLDPDE